MPSTETPADPVGSATRAFGNLRAIDDTVELRLPVDLLPLLAEADLLDSPAIWGSTDTPAGAFRLEPVRADRDLELLTGWMNDPEVDASWELAAPQPSPRPTYGPNSTGTAAASPASASSTARR